MVNLASLTTAELLERLEERDVELSPLELELVDRLRGAMDEIDRLEEDVKASAVRLIAARAMLCAKKEEAPADGAHS